MASTRNSRPFADLAARVSRRLGEHVRRGDRLAVALSGGIDSVVLLHVLHKLSSSLDFRLSAIHVNHGISPQADGWQEFCRSFCLSLDVSLEVKRVSVQRAAKVSLEAAARKARYAAFSEANADWLVLAHQSNDQAETLLFNLLRGAGLAGAAAMPYVRSFPGKPTLRIMRPLLDCSRADVEQYAEIEKLAWVEDESNMDIGHARNFLRRRVYPLLRERFPGCEAVLARAAGHFAEGEALLAQLAEIDAVTALRQGRLSISVLSEWPETRVRNLLRHLLKSEGIPMPDSARLHEAVRQILDAAPDRQVTIDLGKRVLQRYKGEVWIRQHNTRPEPVEWRGQEILTWGGTSVRLARVTGGGLAESKLAGKRVMIKPRLGGESFQPDAKRPRRQLKKLFQERGIPPWEREAMPLLWCEESLIWVPGIGIDCAWQCPTATAGLLPEWQRG